MKRFATRVRELPGRPLRRWALTNALALVALIVISVLASRGASAQAQSVLGSCPQIGAGPTLNLNVLPNIYCNATMGWLGNALTAAQRFFFILVGIELAWSALLWTLQKENLGELVTAFILKLMGIFFFYALLMFGGSWLPAVMQSFIGLAAQVTAPGQPPMALDPMSVFTIGTNICTMLFQKLPTPQFDTNIVHIIIPFIAIVNDLLTWYFFEMVVVFAAVISFVVFASFLIAAGQLIMTLIEAYIMIGAGAVMLGFTGSRWTMSFGEKWIGYAFAIGVKLFVIYIVVALGMAVFPQNCGGADLSGICTQLNAIAGASVQVDITNFGGTANNIAVIFTGYLEIAATAIIFMMLCQRLPGLASSMMNGSPSLTMGAAMSTMMQVAGVVTGVVKAGAGAAMGVAGAAGGAGGLGDAASVGGGIGGGGDEMSGGGSMAVKGGLTDAVGGSSGGSMAPVGGPADTIGSSSKSLSISSTGASSNGSSSNGSSSIGGGSIGGGSNGGGSNGVSPNGGSSNGVSSNGFTSSSTTAHAANSNGTVGSSQAAGNSSANGSSAAESYAKSLDAGFKAASAIGNGVDHAVSSVAAPLTRFDEGTSDGTVHIGLKMPE